MRALILTTMAVAMTLLGLMTFALPARAGAENCAGYGDMMAVLGGRYGEKLLFTGIVASGEKAVVTVSPDGGSWTLMVLGMNGRACVVAVGKKWAVGDRAALGTEG